MEIFIGIDQTGAALSSGLKAKPLPICIAIKQESGSWRFLTEKRKKPLSLESLHPRCLKEQMVSLQLSGSLAKTALILDCVLGIPEATQSKIPAKVKPYLWGLFEKAASFSKEGREFGRSVAEAFFLETFRNYKDQYPKRYCEEISGSNSVFQVRPYQKNIQTGTFRLWKDLGSVGEQWANIWPFDQEKQTGNRPWIFEGYPSLLWKDCLQSPSRDPKKLRRLSEKAFPKFEIDTWKHVERLPDMADSFVLALGGVLLQEEGRLWMPSKGFFNEPRALSEGWLLGLRVL